MTKDQKRLRNFLFCVSALLKRFNQIIPTKRFPTPIIVPRGCVFKPRHSKDTLCRLPQWKGSQNGWVLLQVSMK